MKRYTPVMMVGTAAVLALFINYAAANTSWHKPGTSVETRTNVSTVLNLKSEAQSNKFSEVKAGNDYFLLRLE